MLLLRSMLRLDGRNDLSILERNIGLLDERLITLQPGLYVDRVAKIPPHDNLLHVQFVIRPHEHDLRAFGIEDQRGGRDLPTLADRAGLERDVYELARQHAVRGI